MASVPVTEMLRHQHLDRFPQQLIPAVSEHLFRLTVDENNTAFFVRREDGVRRVFYKSPQRRLGSFCRLYIRKEPHFRPESFALRDFSGWSCLSFPFNCFSLR